MPVPVYSSKRKAILYIYCDSFINLLRNSMKKCFIKFDAATSTTPFFSSYTKQQLQLTWNSIRIKKTTTKNFNKTIHFYGELTIDRKK